VPPSVAALGYKRNPVGTLFFAASRDGDGSPPRLAERGF
jgi:hypothetical protein